MSDIGNYLCVFFDNSDGQAPVALFDRLCFAQDFIHANPGRFREENHEADWIRYGEYMQTRQAAERAER